MATAWIIDSKLLAPAVPVPLLRRALGGPRQLPSVAVLEAGPGGGKTVALLELATRQVEAGRTRVWLTLDELDADPATLFAYLVAGLRAEVPGFGTEVEAALAAGRADARALWRLFFVAAAAACPGGWVLVLDDLQRVGAQAEVVVALGVILERLPTGTSVLVGTRLRPDWPLKQWALAGKALVLDREALRFAPAEVADYLVAQDGAALTAARRAAIARLQGWPLGVASLASGRLTSGLPEAPASLLEDERALGEYLFESLYRPLPRDQQAFLLVLALLEELTVAAAREALAAPDAGARLASLVAGQALEALGDRQSFRLASPLRQALLEEATRTLTPAAARAVHARAAAYHEGRGRLDAALPHWLALEDWGKAAGACQTPCEALAAAGRLAEVSRWLARFPAAFCQTHAGLSLWQGRVAAHEGRLADAWTALARARALAEAAGDRSVAFAAIATELGTTATLADRERYNHRVLEVLPRLAEGRPVDRARFQLARAAAAGLRRDPDLVREANEGVLAIAAEGDATLLALHGRACLALARQALWRGEPKLARRLLSRAEALADAGGTLGARVAVAAARALQAANEGDGEAAARAIAGLPEGWADWCDVPTYAEVQLARAAASLANDELAAAEQQLEDALQRFELLQDDAGLREARVCQAHLALARGEFGRLPALAANAGPAARWGYADVALQALLARALAAGGDLPAALEHWHALFPVLTLLEAREWLAIAHFDRALALARSGELVGAQAEAEAARTCVLRDGLEHLYTREATTLQALDRLLSAAVSARPASRAAAQGLAAPKLEVSLLGCFDVRVGGDARAAWPRRKAKVLLGALLLAPSGCKSLELAELLGEGDAVAGSEILKVNVRALRQTLEPGRDKGGASHFLASRGDGWSLLWAAVAPLDLQAFEQAAAVVLRGDGRAPGSVQAQAEAALALYRGTLFGDDRAGDYFEVAREALRARALAVARWLAGYHGDRHDAAGQEAAWRRACDIAPCDEDASLALMRVYIDAGRPERLAPLYWEHRKALKQALSMQPSPAYERAYGALMADQPSS